MHYPNIPYWEIRFAEDDYAKHHTGISGCKGIIGQPTRKGGMVVTGRPRCLKCARLVGRKAWRKITGQLEEKVLGWDTYPYRVDGSESQRVIYRVFVVERSEKNTAPPFNPIDPQPCPQPKHKLTIKIAVPDGGEPLEIQVSPAVARRLRDAGEEIVDEFGLEALENWVDQVEAEEAIAEVQQEIGHPWPQPGHPLHNSSECITCQEADDAIAVEPGVEVPDPGDHSADESLTGFSYGKLLAMTATPNKKKPHVKKVRRAKTPARRAKTPAFTIQKGLLSYSIPQDALTARAAIQLREAVAAMPLVSTAQTGPDIEHMIDLAMAQSKVERKVMTKRKKYLEL